MARLLITGIGFLLLIALVVLWGDYINSPKAVSDRLGEVEEPTEKAPKQPLSRPLRPPAEPSPAPSQAAPPSEPAAPPVVNAQAIAPPLSDPPVGSGPVETLERAYTKESSDSSARETERAIRSVIGADVIPAEYLRSVTCHKTVCKIGLYWSKQYPLGYMGVIMKVGAQQAGLLAFTSASEPDPDGKSALDLYVVRTGYTLEDVR